MMTNLDFLPAIYGLRYIQKRVSSVSASTVSRKTHDGFDAVITSLEKGDLSASLQQLEKLWCLFSAKDTGVV